MQLYEIPNFDATVGSTAYEELPTLPCFVYDTAIFSLYFVTQAEITLIAQMTSATGFLPLSGGTLVGDLHLTDANVTIDDTSLDGTVDYSSNVNSQGFYIRDINGEFLGRIIARGASYGNGVLLEAHRVVGGVDKYNTLRMALDSSGASTVAVTSPLVWRSALGANAYGVWPQATLPLNFRAGSTSITPVAQGVATKNISFTSLPGVPQAIICTLQTGVLASLRDWSLGVTNMSTTGFTLNVYNAGTSTTARSVSWLAVYVR